MVRVSPPTRNSQAGRAGQRNSLHINYSAVWRTTTTALDTSSRCVTTSRLHLDCYGADGMLEGTPLGQRTGLLVLSDNGNVKMAVFT